MSVFLTLFGKILPLYISIVIGFLSTALLKCDKTTVAKIVLYLLAPLIVFNATLSVKLDFSVLFLPLFFFTLSLFLASLFLAIFRKVWSDNTANLLSFSAATGNTGNIGIPIAIIFLEPALVDVFIFTVLASMLYQNSVGYYIIAKGNFTAKESLIKVLKLPVIHAFLLGLVLNLYGVKMPEVLFDYTEYLKGAYAVFGMMLLGMGMEKVKFKDAFDAKFISLSLIIKFLLWPALVLCFIYLDKNFFFILENEAYYTVMFLFSIVPLAANTVTVATLLNVKPEKMAMAVLISTAISLIFIPLALSWYM